MLTISLLGSLRLEVDGAQLKFAGPRKAAALFAYLLLHQKERLNRQNLAFTLWPDEDEASARAALRRHLYLVTRALPPSEREPWIDADATTVRWNPKAPSTLDVDLFRVYSADDARLGDAAALYAGDLLAAFDDEWIVDERDRLRQRNTENLERLVAKSRETGDFATAIRYAQDMLRLDPWREDAIRHAIALRAELGDRSGALAEFERFARRLRDDLDVEPMPETIAVYTSIVKRSAPAVEIPVTLAAGARWTPADALPFTGRDGPLQQLLQAWSRAVRGRGNLVAIGGEAGLGKTRLIEEFAKHVVAGGGIAFVGETSFIESAPYQPFIDVLRKAKPEIEAAELEAVRLDALATLLPELLGEGEARVTSAPLDAAAERRRLFEAIVAAFAALAAKAPVLLAIEDLHWAGAGTISLLEHLARRLSEARVMILATYREEETLRSHPLRELRRRLQQEGRIVKISLGPLSFDDVREILEDVASAVPALPLASRFFAATEGHPLFLSELVREVAEASASEGEELDTASLPASMKAAIDVRLGRLSEPARALVEAAAIVGRGFDVALLSELTSLHERRLVAAMAELVAGNIVRENAARGSSYNFTHQLFQTRAYERILTAQRTEQHRRIASALEELYPDRQLELSSELAYHLEACGEGERAAACYLLAARRALDLHANEDAAADATRGLALSPAPETRLELLLTREESFGRLGRRREQGEDLERLEALADGELACEALYRRIAYARAVSDRERERAAIASLAKLARSERWQARATLARGADLLANGQYAEAKPILEATLQRFDELGDTAGIVDAALEIVRLYRNERNDEGIREMLRRAEESLDEQPETGFLRAKLIVQQIIVEMMAQHYQAMTSLAEKLLELSISIGYIEGEAQGYRFLGAAAAWQLNVVRARDFLERAARMFEDLGNRLESYSVLAEYGIMSTFVGRFDDAEAAFLEALRAASELEYEFGAASCQVNLAHCYNRSGQFERARAASEAALKIGAPLGTQALIVPTLVNLGVAQRGCGDEEVARSTFERAATLLAPGAGERLGAELYSHLALSQFRTGQTRAAVETLERLLPFLDGVPAGFDSMPEVYFAAIAVLRGLGRAEEADAVAERARGMVHKHLREIPDDETRRAFSSVGVHRALLENAGNGLAGRFSDSAPLESS